MPKLTPADAAPDTTFQPGDVVQLRSGGPLMTVDGWCPADPAMMRDAGFLVHWHVQGTPRSRIYPAEVLKPAKPPPD